MDPVIKKLVELTESKRATWEARGSTFTLEVPQAKIFLTKKDLFVRNPETLQVVYNVKNPTYLYDIVSGEYRAYVILRQLEWL